MLPISIRGAQPLLLFAVPALLLTAGLTGCGSTVSTGDFKGESHAVAQRIADFQRHVGASDEQKLCREDIASAVQAHLRAAGGDCRQALKNQLGAIDDYEISVKSIAVTGATATARVKSTWSGKSRPSTLRLVKEGRKWKITGLG